MATPLVDTFDPVALVTLYKTVGRRLVAGGIPAAERYRDLPRAIDLTAHLGDGGSVRVRKSVRDPAGSWSIVLADKPWLHNTSLETLYGVAEPMDIIEIRFRHAPGAGKPPIVMRGFVSGVERIQGMGADGRPGNYVVLTGQDYGKIWQQLQILYFPSYVIGQDIITHFRLFERFGVGFQTSQKVGDFVSAMVEKIINPYLRALIPERSPSPAELTLDIRVKEGATSITGPQNQEGPVYDLMRAYTDTGPWNELYVEDREDSVACVFRPNPYLALNGDEIQPIGQRADVHDLFDRDVIQIRIGRSDANVANFYWTRAPRFDINTDLYRQLFAVQGAERDTVLLDRYPNSQVALYGTRAMYTETQLGPEEVTEFQSGLPEAPDRARASHMAAWVAKRRKVVVESNKDNVVLESGSIRIRGNEAIKAGSYVRLRRGGIVSMYYVAAVDHEFLPYQAFITTLQVERGTGFAERIRAGAPVSPYLSERRPFA